MTLASKYNELVDSNSLRMSRILSSLENIELKKLSLMKNTAIDYQLEKTTQAAAILSNQQLLSRLDNIVLENTEITPFD